MKCSPGRTRPRVEYPVRRPNPGKTCENRVRFFKTPSAEYAKRIVADTCRLLGKSPGMGKKSG